MKQRVIAVVGPDMTGKTQISTALAGVLGVPRFKASSEHDTYLNHKERFVQQLRIADARMTDFLRQTGHSVVFDRAWPCEFAYSQVFKRDTDMRVLHEIDAQMAAMGARVVICRRHTYKGIIDDIDASIKEERLLELDAAYVDFKNWTQCKTMFLAVDDGNLTRECGEIIDWLREDV